MVKADFSALLLAFLRGVAEDCAFFAWFFVVNLWWTDGCDVVFGGHIFRL